MTSIDKSGALPCEPRYTNFLFVRGRAYPWKYCRCDMAIGTYSLKASMPTGFRTHLSRPSTHQRISAYWKQPQGLMVRTLEVCNGPLCGFALREAQILYLIYRHHGRLGTCRTDSRYMYQKCLLLPCLPMRVLVASFIA